MFSVGTDPVGSTPVRVTLGVNYAGSDTVGLFSDVSVGLPDFMTAFLIAKLYGAHPVLTFSLVVISRFIPTVFYMGGIFDLVRCVSLSHCLS